MSINPEEFAEEYCLALEWGELTYIINDGVNLEDLKDLLHSEFPEEQIPFAGYHNSGKTGCITWRRI